MDSTQKMTAELIAWTALKDRLKTEHQLNDDDQALLDTLEGETDLQEALLKIADEVVEVEAFVDAIDIRIRTLKDRKARMEARADRLRGAISYGMAEAGLKTIKGPAVTISWRIGQPGVSCYGDPVNAPEPYRKTITTYKWDTVKIKEDLQAGKTLEFAKLTNPVPIVSLRTK